MALNKEERLNLLQQYNKTEDFQTKQSIVHKFVRNVFPNGKEYKQIFNYIKLQQSVNKLMKEILGDTHTYGITVGNEYAVLDIIKYF